MADEVLTAIDEATQQSINEITAVKNAGVEEINTNKTTALAELDTAKTNHTTALTTHKDIMVANITTSKDLALSEMGTIKALAIDEIDEYANDISTQQSQAVSTVTSIKDDAILDVDLERDMALSSINSQVLYLQGLKTETETKGATVLADISAGITDIETELINALANIGIDKGLALQAISDAKVAAVNNIDAKLTGLDAKQTEVLTSADTAKTDALGAITNEKNVALAEILEDMLTLEQTYVDLENQRLAIINNGVMNDVVLKGEEAKKQADSAKNYAAVARMNGEFANSKGLYANEQGLLASQKATDANNAAMSANTQALIAQEKASLAENKANLAQSKADLVDAKVADFDRVVTNQKLTYLPMVQNRAEIDTKYQNPTLGDVVQTVDDGTFYRYQNGQWVQIYRIINVQGNKMIVSATVPTDTTVLFIDTNS